MFKSKDALYSQIFVFENVKTYHYSITNQEYVIVVS